MFFVPPLSTRKQDRRVSALVRKGTTTEDEIFEAQFGEQPKGLEKDTPCNDPVYFKPYGHGPRNWLAAPFTMGYVDPNANNRTIYLNRVTLSAASPVTGLLTGRMVTARLHDLLEPILGVEVLRQAAIILIGVSLASSYRYAIVSSFAKVAMPSVSDIVGEELIHLKQIAEGPMSITARRAFLNDAENVLQNQPEPWKTWTNVKQAVDSILTMMPRKQQAADNEMQARLHNGNVRGYSRWGRIPASPDELVAALWDLGVKPSNEVKNFMRSPHQKQLRAIFNKYSQQTGYVAAPIAELNIGLNYFRSEEVVERFYRDYLHVMYGDLLVKYGDSQGLERMGFSSTERDLLGMPVPLKALPAPTPMGP